jgi:hypothetical protein
LEECVHRTQIPPLSAKENRAITPERTKWLKSKIELGLPVMVTVLVYRFQMICLRGDLLY